MSTQVEAKHKLIQFVDELTLNDLRRFINSFPKRDTDNPWETVAIKAYIEHRGAHPDSRGLCLVLEAETSIRL